MRRSHERREFLRELAAVAVTKWPHPNPNIQGWDAHVRFGSMGRWDLFDSEIDRILATLMGNPRELARLVPPEVYAQVRGAFAEGRDPLEAILGHDDPEDGWKPGMAGLSPQEARAFSLSLRMREDGEPDLREIALHMDRKAPPPGRRRVDALFPGFQPVPVETKADLPLETVNRYLKYARRKIRELLTGARAPGGTSQSTNSHISSPSSTATPETLDAATLTLRILPRTRSFATSSAASLSGSP